MLVGDGEDYQLKNFVYEEELIDSVNYPFCSIGRKNNEYGIFLRKIESNAKNRKTLLLINCIRHHKGNYYRLTKFSMSLDKLPISNLSFQRKSAFASQSFFSDGSSWFKFSNHESGLYKLDYNFC